MTQLTREQLYLELAALEKEVERLRAAIGPDYVRYDVPADIIIQTPSCDFSFESVVVRAAEHRNLPFGRRKTQITGTTQNYTTRATYRSDLIERYT